MRVLFEQYRIAPETIAMVAGYQTDTIERYARSQGWVVAYPLLDIRDRLIEKIAALVARFATADADPGDDEKLARTLTHLLKSMEQMNGLDAIPDQTNKIESIGPDFSLGLAGGPDHTAELDRRLASLLADAATRQET